MNWFKKSTDKEPTAEKKEKGNINISGETVSFEKVVNYFNESWRSHDIEAMLDYREAASRAEANKKHDYSYMIPLGIFVFIALLGVGVLYSTGFFSHSASTALPETPKIISAVTGTSLTG